MKRAASLLSPLAQPSSHGPVKASQRFICLKQLVSLSDLPPDLILREGRTYQYPFKFKVPWERPPSTEAQTEMNKMVQQAQLKLPPSLGSAIAHKSQQPPVPNTRPNVASISYCIRAKVVNTQRGKIIGEWSRAIKIMPVCGELPPICDDLGRPVIARAQKYFDDTKQWQGSLGMMYMQVAQPKSICLPISTGYDVCSKLFVETTAHIQLRFEPIEAHGVPPPLDRFTGNLRAATRASTHAMSDCPFEVGLDMPDGTDHGLSVATIPLRESSLKELKWKAALSVLNRRFFLAQFPARLAVPLEKHLVPTFHSSLISHFYVLTLSVKLQTANKIGSPKRNSICVEVPVQLSTEVYVNEASQWSDDSG